MVRWVDLADHRGWLRQQLVAQLRFGRGFAYPGGGAGYLDDQGVVDLSRPVHTWITARMLYVYSLGHLAGIPGCKPLAQKAMAGLTGPLADEQHGGWFTSAGPAPGQRDTMKTAYAHAFVVLGASAAQAAEVPGAQGLLDDALEVLDHRFWEPDQRMHCDSVSADWSEVTPYRGINANMHAVEALLTASDVTGEVLWRQRAAQIAQRVLSWSQGNLWRVPEHFDESWNPKLDHNGDQPDHPFEPYGATVGHGLEWSRLALQLHAALDEGAPPELVTGAQALFDRAVRDGWSVDGAEGFVYTTDWLGRPVVRTRMHWVVAEAISAAAALAEATGDHDYEKLYRQWWDYAATYLITEDGSWHHELDAANRPSGTVWPGRPDLYHTVHASLLQQLPLSPSAPVALAEGLIRRIGALDPIRAGF